MNDNERDLEAAATFSKNSLLKTPTTPEEEDAQYIGRMILEAEAFFAERCTREAELMQRLNAALELEEMRQEDNLSLEEEDSEELPD